MSKAQFRRYIFGATTTELSLFMALALVSGGSLAALAIGTENVKDAATLVGGLTAQELLALVAIISIGFAWYCVRQMVGQNARATVELTKIADRMATMRCVRDSVPWNEWAGQERRDHKNQNRKGESV